MKLSIRYKLTAPLSHIGETASTGSYFQTVLTSYGKLPVITANSIRGQIRNSGAAHLLDTWGIKVDKDIFHVLFSGGNLSEVMRNDIEKALKVREIFPLISVLGGGLGDMIMAGKSNFTFAYPICAESYDITKIESEISWHKLIEEMEFTRTDDSKNDELAKYIEDMEAEKTTKASTQMRYSVQYMATGTEFVQQISLTNATDIEKGAIINAICEWFKEPVLGGMASKGFGYFDAWINEDKLTVVDRDVKISGEFQALIDKYNDFIKTVEYAPYIDLLKGGKKGGKKTDKAAESDS